MTAAPEPWSAAYLGPAFAMWALMMVAMMLPSAAPMILLYGMSIVVASVNDRVVLLSGTAASASDHLRAIQTARAVPGVSRVETQVTSPYALTDEELWRNPSPPTSGADRGVVGATKDMWITTDTKARLLADSRTPALAINVDTWNGVVTLFGTVPSEDAKSAAGAGTRPV